MKQYNDVRCTMYDEEEEIGAGRSRASGIWRSLCPCLTSASSVVGVGHAQARHGSVLSALRSRQQAASTKHPTSKRFP